MTKPDQEHLSHDEAYEVEYALWLDENPDHNEADGITEQLDCLLLNRAADRVRRELPPLK